jgi:hypothetical protein
MMTSQGASKVGFRLALAFWLGQILVIVSSWRFLPAKLPLFYSRPWGEEQLTTPPGLLIIPFLSLAIFKINLIVASFATNQESLAREILAVTSAIFNFLGLIALIQIVRLVV